MRNSDEVMKEFMDNLENGKFVRPKVPNPPPYYDGNNKDILKDYEEFLNSDLSKAIMNLK